MEIKERIRQLVDELNTAREEYEQGTDEVMSNKEYDEKLDELERLEKETGIVFDDSPSINVGYDVKDTGDFVKEKHETKMLSLDKTKDILVLKEWIGNRDGVLSWKLDGLTVVITYNNGVLEKAVTRGNGEVGEVVTRNARLFSNLPKNIEFKGRLLLRGEAVISYAEFERVNKLGIFKNPRNLCSGTVRCKNEADVRDRNVNWICFEVVNWREVGISKFVDEQFKWVESLGFETVGYIKVNNSSLENGINVFKSNIENNEYPSDGLVLAIRDKHEGEMLGNTNKFPRHSIAFKWQDKDVETTLNDIEWQVGKSGVITPVAVFNEVDIDGSTVKKASLHNISIMDKVLGTPYKGEKIFVYKANMIIPQVSGAEQRDEIEFDKVISIPRVCPKCGAVTKIRRDDNSGVLSLWCTNDNCSGANIQKFKHAVSRDALNIEGMSEETIKTFVRHNLISEISDLYYLEDNSDYIMDIEGFGDKSVNKLLDAIDKSREIKAGNFIYALGIPNVGLNTAKLIARKFGVRYTGDDDEVSPADINATDLVGIEGIGAVTICSYVKWFDEHLEEFNNLWNCMDKVIPEESASDNALEGLTFCVTGDVYIFKNRNEVKEYIEKHGGKLTGSVSKSTSFLITNDTTSGSNKNKLAKEYGIEIIDEKQFIDRFGK